MSEPRWQKGPPTEDGRWVVKSSDGYVNVYDVQGEQAMCRGCKSVFEFSNSSVSHYGPIPDEPKPRAFRAKYQGEPCVGWSEPCEKNDSRYVHVLRVGGRQTLGCESDLTDIQWLDP